MKNKKDIQYTVPEDSIVITPTYNQEWGWKKIPELIEDMRGKIKRDWFVDHAYFCLPLTIGNQYGYGIKSLHTFDIEWNGGINPNDVTITMIEEDDSGIQRIEAHFGMGLVTVQNHVVFHTPKFVNLLTTNAPNIFIDGLFNMNGVVETDNLKRDFTFNLRVTRPNHKIRINKGDIISGIIPIQRYFVDSFKTYNGNEVMDDGYIKHIEEMSILFAEEREGVDTQKPHGNGRRYFNGEDATGCPFHDHQRKIKK